MESLEELQILMKKKDDFDVEEETLEESTEIVKREIGEKKYNEIFGDNTSLTEEDIKGIRIQPGFVRNKDIPVLLKNSNFHQMMTTIRKNNLRGQRINDYARDMIYDDIEYIEEHSEMLNKEELLDILNKVSLQYEIEYETPCF